jgi:cation diffusion facilitator family transporter
MRSQVILVATLLLNASLFLLNLAVALVSGSRTVLSQAIYSVTDLMGSGFLLWGLHASRRPADPDHPFGYGMERFFWAFVATVVTFTIAGVAAVVTGLDQLVAPQPVSHLFEALGVVAATVAASLAGIWITLRELRLERQTLQALLGSAHQGLKTIFYQDLVAIVGAAIAFAGLLVIYRTQNFAIDGAVDALEGVLLIATGFVLSRESRAYLVGRAIDAPAARDMLALVERHPKVRRVHALQSMQLGPDDALLALRLNFEDGLTTDEIEVAIDELGQSLRSTYPVLRHIIIEPES